MLSGSILLCAAWCSVNICFLMIFDCAFPGTIIMFASLVKLLLFASSSAIGTM